MEARQELRLFPTRPFAIGLTVMALLVGGVGGYTIAALTPHPQTVAGAPAQAQPATADRTVAEHAAAERADRAAQAPVVGGAVVGHVASERNDRAAQTVTPVNAGVVEHAATERADRLQ